MNRLKAVIIVLILAALACQPLTTTATPQNQPTAPSNARPEATPIKKPTKPPTSAPKATARPTAEASSGALNADGPWLIVATADGLQAVNPDGSGLQALTDTEFWQEHLADAIQPGGNYIVLLTADSDRIHNLALNLLSLPDGQMEKITDLTSPDTEPAADAAPGDPSFEAMRAIVEQRSFAWSPDGTKLAFIGVMDGPSADLYLYDVAQKDIKRVTQDDAQNYWPAWSPDGKYLLVFGAESFGTGAGYNMKGVWSARGDGTNVTMLYTPTSGAEELVGWADNTTAILDSWNAVCGSALLRRFDLANARQTILNKDCFNQAAASPEGNVLFTNDKGLYLVPAGSKNPQQLLKEQVQIAWKADSYVFAVTFADGGMTTFNLEGKDRQDAPISVKGSSLDVAMYGAIWGWTSSDENEPGVWITGPGLDIGQIFKEPAYLPLWDAKNNLLFFSGQELYRATFTAQYADTAGVTQFTSAVFDAKWAGLK